VHLLEWTARVVRKRRAAGGGAASSVTELTHEDDEGVDELLSALPFLSETCSSRSILK
jgi:hypothetical protein